MGKPCGERSLWVARKRVHLLAAYLPKEGVVLAQVQVSTAGSEVSAAPVLLASLDLRATVVSGDALFASRKLSQQILQAKGDYLWTIKENQIQMYQDIQTLFTPPQSRPGWSAPPTDFRSASSVNKGHGRLENRRITVSSLLASYSQWPGLSQVFKLERERTNTLGDTEQEVCYGITSLPASVGTRHPSPGAGARTLGDRKWVTLSSRSDVSGRPFSTAYGPCSSPACHSQQHGAWLDGSSAGNESSPCPAHFRLSIRSRFGSLDQLGGRGKLCNSPGLESRGA